MDFHYDVDKDPARLKEAAEKLNNIPHNELGWSGKLELALGIASTITDPVNEWHFPRNNVYYSCEMLIEEGNSLFYFYSKELSWGHPVFSYYTKLSTPWAVEGDRIKGVEAIGNVEKITYLELYRKVR